MVDYNLGRGGRFRTTLEDCQRYARRIERLMFDISSYIDTMYTESDLQRLQPAANTKYPDCSWHRKSCWWVVVEEKASNVAQALLQLRNFARRFHYIHERTVGYFIVVEASRKGKYMRARGLKCQAISGAPYCKLIVDLGRVKKDLEIGGRPVFLLSL